MKAHDFVAVPQDAPLHPFGIDCAYAADALRKLADEFESGKTAIESVRVQTLARADDFASTLLRIKFYERKS